MARVLFGYCYCFGSLFNVLVLLVCFGGFALRFLLVSLCDVLVGFTAGCFICSVIVVVSF